MFRSYESRAAQDYVTFIANYQPLQAPYGGPNYFTMDPDALYEIHIDTDADAVEDMTFQFDFDNNLTDGTGISLNIGGEMRRDSASYRRRRCATAANVAETESFELFMVEGDRRTGVRVSRSEPTTNRSTIWAPNHFPDYPGYAARLCEHRCQFQGCGATGRVFAGQRAEAFAVNLGAVFDLVNFVPIDGDVPLNAEGRHLPRRHHAGAAPMTSLVGKANVTSLAIRNPDQLPG